MWYVEKLSWGKLIVHTNCTKRLWCWCSNACNPLKYNITLLVRGLWTSLNPCYPHGFCVRFNTKSEVWKLALWKICEGKLMTQSPRTYPYMQTFYIKSLWQVLCKHFQGKNLRKKIKKWRWSWFVLIFCEYVHLMKKLMTCSKTHKSIWSFACVECEQILLIKLKTCHSK